MFLHVSVCPQEGSTWAGTPRTRYTPQNQVHPPDQVHHLGRYTPWDQVPPGRYTPGPGTHPRSSACWEIRTTSRRYASYWNAFLLKHFTGLLERIPLIDLLAAQYVFRCRLPEQLHYHDAWQKQPLINCTCPFCTEGEFFFKRERPRPLADTVPEQTGFRDQSPLGPQMMEPPPV